MTSHDGCTTHTPLLTAGFSQLFLDFYCCEDWYKLTSCTLTTTITTSWQKAWPKPNSHTRFLYSESVVTQTVFNWKRTPIHTSIHSCGWQYTQGKGVFNSCRRWWHLSKSVFFFFALYLQLDSVCKIDAQFDDENFIIHHLGMSNLFLCSWVLKERSHENQGGYLYI